MTTLSVLDLSMPTPGAVEHIHPVVIRTGKDNILVDCGFVGSLPLLEAALRQNGLEPRAITAVVLTHHDHDHMGAAAAFQRAHPQVRLCASALEAPWISAAQTPPRLLQAQALQKQLPPEAQDFGRAFCALLQSVEPVEIDLLLHDGDDLLESGFQVVATPGHTPGHISLYSRHCSTVIAGDALALEQGRPVMANPQFTLHPEQASRSMSRLLGMGAETILCYHGGSYSPA